MKNCLVTGGSGFLGSHVCNELTKRGYRVTIFDKKKSQSLKSKQKVVIGKLSNIKLLEKLVKKNDVIFHFAGMANLDEAIHKPLETVNYNILSTVKLLNLCKKYKVKRFIYASTIYASSKIGGFYGVSKRATEDYIREYCNLYNLKFTIIRYGSLFGPRSGKDNGLKKIILNALKKNEVIYGGSNQTIRRYIDVTDASMLTVNVLRNIFINKHIVISGKKSIKIKTLLGLIKKYLKIKSNIVYKNRELAGHYEKTPDEYKIEKEIKVYSKKKQNINKKIKNLINHIKKNEI